MVIKRLIQLLCKENDDWTVELSRLHDRSTVHRKLTQLQIITQIENFRLIEGESKEKRAANPESTPKWKENSFINAQAPENAASVWNALRLLRLWWFCRQWQG